MGVLRYEPMELSGAMRARRKAVISPIGLSDADSDHSLPLPVLGYVDAGVLKENSSVIGNPIITFTSCISSPVIFLEEPFSLALASDGDTWVQHHLYCNHYPYIGIRRISFLPCHRSTFWSYRHIQPDLDYWYIVYALDKDSVHYSKRQLSIDHHRNQR